MRPPALDPTAGERARWIRMHPDAPPRISDPMDSRYGTVVAPTPTYASASRIVDPTDPSCGETSG
jgi:hypothetical protein